MPKTLRMLCSLLIVLLVSLAPCARALEINGSGTLGSFRGTLEVRCGDDGRQAVLTLELTNTASPGDDAVITGWYLNNPGGRITSVTMPDSIFALLGGPVFRNSIDASPAGYYDIGAEVTSGPAAAGENSGSHDANPAEGSAKTAESPAIITAGPGAIAAGRTQSFQLILQGADLQGLDADSFADERPEGGECFLAVRFQGSAEEEAETVTASRVSSPETVVTAAAGSSIPRGYALLPNYPNPFNASTNIGFQIPAAGHVSLTIYDVLGRVARRLVDQHQQAGNYIARWNGRDNHGKVMKSGVYFCVFESGSCRETIKMVLSR